MGVVLDEPEIGLHPNALTVLSEIIKAVANNDSQVIIFLLNLLRLLYCFEADDFIMVDYENGVSLRGLVKISRVV